MRILLTGAGGFLGSRLLAYYGEKYEVWAPSHGELDFTEEEKTREAVRLFRPDVLLHCGAISDVGTCEREQELSLRVNVEGTRNLARSCRSAGARMVMCSSDQVYFRRREEGESREAFLSPHREEESCRPITVYGKHKLLAEEACLAEQPDSVILRLTWMYGELTEEERRKGKGNLAATLRKMLREKRRQTFLTTDYRGVTDVNEVVRQMEAAWRLRAGIYNFGSPSSGSIYETARSVLEAFGAGELGEPAERKNGLRNLAMDVGKAERAESAGRTEQGAGPEDEKNPGEGTICFPDSAEGLKRFLKQEKISLYHFD